MATANRRDFLKQVFFYTSAGVLTHMLVSARAFAAEPMLIDMSGKKRTDPDNKSCVATATSLGYVEDLAKAQKNLPATKKSVPNFAPKVDKPKHKALAQTCDTCMFYNYKRDSAEGHLHTTTKVFGARKRQLQLLDT